MEILYISSVPSENEFYRMKQLIKDGANVVTYGMNEAGFKFNTLLMEGLCKQENVNLYSLVGRSASYKSHKGLFWKSSKEQTKGNLKIKHLSFINIPYIKQLNLGFSYFFNTLSWLHKNKHEDKYIIMDASYITALPFVLAASKFGKCKKTAFFCDLYEYMANVKDARKDHKVNLKTKIARYFTTKNYKKLDGFILLTEQMNKVINKKLKPYVIIEGLVDVNMEKADNDINKKCYEDVIMYAGALREEYGIKNLIEGFINYKNENARLWLFGDGDYVSEIKKLTNIDKRIKFYGSINLNEVIENELMATLLVNPRPSSLEYTQYSFPSKNMEYMVSGTPILTTKLPGMPIEYYGYVYFIDGDCSSDITKSLEFVIGNNSKHQLHEKGTKAKQFVINNKNNNIQASKITDLFKLL